jgi:cbb3-type cytochrome oxidase cytochrome c subunit
LGTPWPAAVVEVYRKFIRVELKKTIETINRWDILELRGRDVMNGCFYGFEVRG